MLQQQKKPAASYPFLLGTTSYIIPDEIIPNYKILAPIVDDIELVLFESPDVSNIPSKSDISTLRKIAQNNNCGFTIHLPTDRKAGSPDPGERKMFVASAKNIIDRCTPLDPSAWILHLEGLKHDSPKEELDSWNNSSSDTMDRLCLAVEHPEKICVENLDYKWKHHIEIAEKNSVSLCCDVGHLWINFPNTWENDLTEMLPMTKVIHLHGAAGGKDHISLVHTDHERLNRFTQIISDSAYKGIVTLEIFNERDFLQSKEALKKSWEKSH